MDSWADVVSWHEFSSQWEGLSAVLASVSSIRSRLISSLSVCHQLDEQALLTHQDLELATSQSTWSHDITSRETPEIARETIRLPWTGCWQPSKQAGVCNAMLQFLLGCCNGMLHVLWNCMTLSLLWNNLRIWENRFLGVWLTQHGVCLIRVYYVTMAFSHCHMLYKGK